MNDTTFDTYDFLINDEDEAMLLLYVRDGAPENSSIEIDIDEKSAILHRNDTDSITLQNIPDDVLDSLQDADKLLICELSLEEDEKNTKIVYAYEAEIND